MLSHVTATLLERYIPITKLIPQNYNKARQKGTGKVVMVAVLQQLFHKSLNSFLRKTPKFVAYHLKRTTGGEPLI